MVVCIFCQESFLHLQYFVWCYVAHALQHYRYHYLYIVRISTILVTISDEIKCIYIHRHFPVEKNMQVINTLMQTQTLIISCDILFITKTTVLHEFTGC